MPCYSKLSISFILNKIIVNNKLMVTLDIISLALVSIETLLAFDEQKQLSGFCVICLCT